VPKVSNRGDRAVDLEEGRDVVNGLGEESQQGFHRGTEVPRRRRRKISGPGCSFLIASPGGCGYRQRKKREEKGKPGTGEGKHRRGQRRGEQEGF